MTWPSLSRVFIERPRLAGVVSIVLAFSGILAIPHLATEEFPDVAPPQVHIMTGFAGADAGTVVETVASPIEDQLNSVEDLVYYSSTSDSQGGYACTLTFKTGTNPDMAMVNVQNALKKAEPLLPSEVRRTGLEVSKRTSSSVIMYAFTTDGTKMSELQLGNFVSRDVKDLVARVDGVASIAVYGAKEYAMRVWLDPVRMSALGVSTEEVESAIAGQNIQAAPGDVGADGSNASRTYKLTTRGRLRTPRTFGDIVVRSDENGGVIHLKDLARVELGANGYAQRATLDGHETCYIDVFRQVEANALATGTRIKEVIGKMKMPPGVTCSIAYDPTQYIRTSISEIVETLLLALVAVMLITGLFLQDFRTTLIPCIAIPISILATFPVLLALGYTINLLTMLALVLVIGSLCDDAIVVTENCQTLIVRDGLTPREAALKCMHEITGAVIATTLVSFACFVPFFFYGGLVGRIYIQFAVTMSVALGFSTVVAIVQTPVLCALLLKPSGAKRPNRLFAPFNGLLALMRRANLSVTGHLVRHGVITVVLTMLTGVGLWFFSRGVESGFIPDEDKGFFMCDVELAPGTSLARTEKVLAEFLASVRDIPGIESIMMEAGSSMISGMGENYGTVFVQLKDWSHRTKPGESQDEIVAEMQRRADAIPEAKIVCMAMSPLMDLGTTDGLEFQFCSQTGASGVRLAGAARQFADRVRRLPGAGEITVSLDGSTPQVFLDVDRDRAETLGVPIDGLFASLQRLLSAYYVNDFSLGGNNYHVVVQADADFRRTPESLGEIQVANNEGQFVPLSSFCAFKKRPDVRLVNRFNKQTSVAMSVGVASGSDAELMRRIEAAAAEVEDYHVEWTGVAREQRDNEGRLLALLVLACFFAYLFLVALYESWTLPVSILLTVVFALFGAFATLYLCRETLSVYAQLGLVILIGLAAKNAILMVEYSRKHRQEGAGIEAAALAGSQARFRAVLMTAGSFIFGVIPLVLATGAGSASCQAIGLVTLGGMLAATVIGISFPPAYFALIERMKRKSIG